MTKLITIVLLLVPIKSSKAQIPAGYYNNAYNGAVPKACDVLKTALYNIISANTTVLPYNSNTQFDTWNALNIIDTQFNDANTAYEIWDMYTDNPAGINLYSFAPVTSQCGEYSKIGDCYNREHSFPQVWFGSVAPMQTDLHHLFATDGFSNGKHDNYPFGQVKATAVDWSSPAGARLGASASSGYFGKVFEPVDAYKGDFARAMFYMVTRYENMVTGWQANTGADSVLNGTTWPALDNWAIAQWYQWHIQDPVSQKEINRNNKVYTMQNNRNPFIDHPEYVELIWKCTGLLPVTLAHFSVKENGSNITLQWTTEKESELKEYVAERSVDGIHFNVAGIVKAQNLASYFFNDENPAVGSTLYYRLKMIDRDGQFTYSKIIAVKWRQTNAAVSVFPNPAFNQISIKLNQPLTESSILRISDVTGREIIHQQKISTGQSAFTVKIEQLPAGRYVVTIAGNITSFHESFVIIK